MACNSDHKKQVKDFLENLDSKTLRGIIMETLCLECKKCSGLLTPPIAYIDQIGNVCGNCSETYKKKILNVNLNTIIQDCKVPCVYTNNGCSKQISFSSLYDHQKICEYQNYRCPLNCNDFHRAGSLLQHVQDLHCRELQNLSGKTLPITIILPFQLEEYNSALNFRKSLFFCKVKYDPKTHLHYGILYAGNESRDFTYQINQVD